MTNYQSGVEWLDDNSPFFLTMVLNIGTPVMDTSIDTLMVRSPRDSPDDYELAINPDFIADCTPAEVAGCLAHETLHILLRHLHEESDRKRYPNAKALMIAHEVIVNDRLANSGFDLPAQPYYGPDVLGIDTSAYHTHEIYDMLVDMADAIADMAEPTCSEHGQISDAAAQALTNDMRQAAEQATDSQKASLDQNTLDDLNMGSDISDKADASGSGQVSKEKFAKDTGVKLDWVKLLEQVSPDILRQRGGSSSKVKSSWAAQRKNLMHLHKTHGVMLPSRVRKGDPDRSRRGNNKPSIVLALDTSGSIPREMVDKMTSLARSIPDDKVDVHCCTFSSYYLPYDHRADHNRIAFGNTRFSAVEEFIQDTIIPSTNKYPNAIVCITDGGSVFDYNLSPTQDQLDNAWTWVAIDARAMQYMSRNHWLFVNHVRLTDYI